MEWQRVESRAVSGSLYHCEPAAAVILQNIPRTQSAAAAAALGLLRVAFIQCKWYYYEVAVFQT